MLISDELFDAYLKCKTKAQLTFGLAGTDEPSHAISDWQRRLAENYEADCRDRLQAAEKENYLVGSPRPEDLRSAKYRLIIEPYITAQGVGSRIHAIERGPAPVQKFHSPYAPIRFVPLEKISRHHKLMLAFDAFVLWKATGQVPTKGMIIHGLQHKTLGVKLDVWIHNVSSQVTKLSALLRGETSPDPVLIKHCSECVFEACCRKQVAERDDLSLIDGLGTAERVKLNAKGIFTVTQLAYTFRPHRRPKHQASRREKYHHALKALAIRDRKIHVVGKPELAFSGTPVYLDVESLPDRGFYYLIGLRVPTGASFLQYSLWADESKDEERIWRSLLDILHAIENPVLIHYGAYEISFLKRLAGRYPASIADTAYFEALVKR